MSDMSWYAALVSCYDSGSAGSGGTSDYDKLKNRPVINLEGDGVVITSLSSGVYNIDGTWKMTGDDDKRSTMKDDLFYVLNENGESKMTRISAGMVEIFKVQDGGQAEDILYSRMATTDDVVSQLVGDF